MTIIRVSIRDLRAAADRAIATDEELAKARGVLRAAQYDLDRAQADDDSARQTLANLEACWGEERDQLVTAWRADIATP